MPIIKSAIKRAKQAQVRRERNVETKKSVKSAVKAFMAKPSAKTLSAAHSEIDTAVKKNVLSVHTAARRKSALSKVAKEAGVKLEAAKKTTATKKTAATKAPAKKTTTKAETAKKPAAKSTAAKKPAAKKTTAAKAPAKKTAAKKD